MLYSEKMKEILLKLGVDISKLDDNLYSTLLEEIDAELGNLSNSGNTLKDLLDYTKSACYMFFWNSDINDITPYIKFNDTENVTNMESMFKQCGSLTNVPLMNTSKVTNMSSMFSYCTSLISVPALDVSNVNYMSGIFNGCSKLANIDMLGMKVSFDLSDCKLLSREVLIKIFNNCQTITTNQTITLGSTLLAKLTDEDKLIATNKGWELQ